MPLSASGRSSCSGSNGGSNPLPTAAKQSLFIPSLSPKVLPIIPRRGAGITPLLGGQATAQGPSAQGRGDSNGRTGLEATPPFQGRPPRDPHSRPAPPRPLYVRRLRILPAKDPADALPRGTHGSSHNLCANVIHNGARGVRAATPGSRSLNPRGPQFPLLNTGSQDPAWPHITREAPGATARAQHWTRNCGADRLWLRGLPRSLLCVQVGRENTASLFLVVVLGAVAQTSLPASPGLAENLQTGCWGGRKLQKPT